MEFASKEYFLLLLLLIPYIVWYFFYRAKREPSMRMSDTYAFQYAPKLAHVHHSFADVVALLDFFPYRGCHGSSTDT